MINQEEIQNAIEWIEGLRNGWNDEDNIKYCNMAIKTLEQTRWIPVSEKLPEAGEYTGDVATYYLVQNEYGDMLVARYTHSEYWEQIYQLKPYTDKIVAWMPLPEPYKAESEDKLDGDPIDIDKAIEHYEGTLEVLKGIDLEVQDGSCE